MPDKAQAQKFLDELFSGRPEESRILIWSLPSKSSRWFSSTEDAAGYGAGLEGAEVYLGCGLAGKDMGPNARCKAADIVGVPGVWIDIDVKGPTHKKPNLPPNRKEAMKLLDGAPLKPTIVVDSGGGYQAWWCFREFWTFDIDEERQNAERVTRGWNQTMKNLAAEKGWDIDATWDLARIFRLPGTSNNKGAKPRSVKVVTLNGNNRYNISDFEEYLSETKESTNDWKDIRIKLSTDANPPFEKFEALLENVPKARYTWERNRKDLIDQSASSYNMALANYCAQASWTDQEIVNALIAWRRKHKESLKLREDYYARTIAKAREQKPEDEDEKETTLTIDAEASPAVEKFERLLENIKAKKTWEKKRTDIKGSPLSYDMALASFCLLSFWKDQEIINIIIARRRKHGESFKEDLSYYIKLIKNTKKTIRVEDEKVEAYNEIEETIENKSDGEISEEDLMEKVNAIAETKIKRIIKILSDPPEYIVVLKDGKQSNFGSSKHLLNYQSFQQRYFDLAEEVLPDGIKRYQWLNVVKAMTKLLAKPDNRIDLGPEASESGQVAEWIDHYLTYRKPSESFDNSIVEKDLPWKDNEGNIYIRSDDFRTYLDRRLNIRFTPKQIPKLFKAQGLEQTKKKLVRSNTTRGYWKLKPASL